MEKEDSGIHEFNPDWRSHPGETIECVLEDRGWSVDQFVEKMKPELKDHESKALLAGYKSIDARTAKKLSDVIGSSRHFWLTREADYREAHETELGIPREGYEPITVYLPKETVDQIRSLKANPETQWPLVPAVDSPDELIGYLI